MTHTFLQYQLDNVYRAIIHADQKIAFVGTFYTAILVYMLQKKDPIYTAISSSQFLNIQTLVLLMLVYFFIQGSYFLYKAILPSLENKTASLIFFGTIAKSSLKEYEKSILKLNDEELKEQLVEQIYTNSVIAIKKMEAISKSIKILILLFILTTIVTFLLK